MTWTLKFTPKIHPVRRSPTFISIQMPIVLNKGQNRLAHRFIWKSFRFDSTLDISVSGDVSTGGR